jgi:hypothetical protein
MANNAHSNIDSLINLDDLVNEIDPSTIQESRAGLSPFALYRNALYKAFTKGGEEREIFRQGYPDLGGGKERQMQMLFNVMKEFQQNPALADTVTAKTRPGIMAELNHPSQPLRYLKHLFSGK